MPTVGIAVPVPQPHRDVLEAARSRCGDPLAGLIPAHVTLLPPTEVPSRDEPALVAHLERVAGEHAPFLMSLRGTGTFRPVSSVVFVQVARGIPNCEALERAVRSGPVRRDLDFPYHPHVTIAHNVRDDALDLAFDDLAEYRVDFEVTAFELYHHGDDGVWRTVRTFALGGVA